MRILHTVCNYLPSVGGNQQVVQHLSEQLVEYGHEVTVLTSFHEERDFTQLNGVKIEQFEIWGTKAVGIHGEIGRYQEHILRSDYDVIMNYGSNVWTTDLTFDLLPKIKAKKILCPVGHTPLLSKLWRIVYWQYYKKLSFYMQKYDKIVYTSEKYSITDEYLDKNFGDAHNIGNYCVIPNAVLEEEFNKSPTNFRERYSITTPYMLLTVGYHQHIKGHEFVIKAFNGLRRDDVTLVIIGDDIKTTLPIHSCYKNCYRSSKLNNNIRLFSRVPRADTIDAFLEADIYLLGSKYECSPITILEAMASKMPFISTNVGNVSQMPGGYVITTPEEMTSKIEMLLNDQTLRENLGKTGYETFIRKYTWKIVARKFEKLYQTLLEPR